MLKNTSCCISGLWESCISQDRIMGRSIMRDCISFYSSSTSLETIQHDAMQDNTFWYTCTINGNPSKFTNGNMSLFARSERSWTMEEQSKWGNNATAVQTEIEGYYYD